MNMIGSEMHTTILAGSAESIGAQKTSYLEGSEQEKFQWCLGQERGQSREETTEEREDSRRLVESEHEWWP